MSWTLGGTTLPEPQDYQPSRVEDSVVFITANNKVRKQTQGYRNSHRLSYTYLTQAQLAVFETLLDSATTFTFVVSSGSLSINTTVVATIESKGIPTGSLDYLTNLVISLEEIE